MYVKCCSAQHNALKGAKLLVGNLEKYRDIENHELVDKGEGTFSFAIEFLKGAKIPIAWANFLFQGAMGFGNTSGTIRLPGKFHTYIDKVEVNQVGLDFVEFDYAKVDIIYTAPNTYIFCVSVIEQDPMQSKPFPSYDDFWIVGRNAQDLTQFSNRVGSLLLTQLKGTNIDGGISNLSLAEASRIEINIRHGPVKYVQRNLVFSHETPESFNEVISRYLDVPFCKPSSFSEEREYRFIFAPIVGNRLLVPRKEDVLLDLHVLTAP